jgi:Uma2 family endonuclease
MMLLKDMPRMTLKQYRLLPETGPRYQLIEGNLYMAPVPDRYHQDVSANLQHIITNYVRNHRLAKIYDAPFDVYLSAHDVYQQTFSSCQTRALIF